MNNKLTSSIVGGIVGTIVMTVIMFLAAKMGMPKMNPPVMLATTMGFSVAMGWIMHFIIGIIFALAYGYLFLPKVQKIKSKVAKGAIYGVIIFVFAQIMMQVMGAMFSSMPAPQGNMMLMIVGSIVGHVIFAIVVALFFKQVNASS
ncbi:MAG: DUF6789 family protein [Chitinophagales bacterium]